MESPDNIIKHFQALSLLLVAMFCSCGNPVTDELQRAQSELDQRQYPEAIERLEALAQENPSVEINERYVDLLSSAYLGQSGLDIIDTFSHWIEVYEKSKDSFDPDVKSGTKQISIGKYKNLISDLLPPDLNRSRENLISKAAALSSYFLKDAQRRKSVSSRVLVKSLLVNLWGAIGEIDRHLIPAIEHIVSSRTPNGVCRYFVRAISSVGEVSTFSKQIALSLLLLKDRSNKDIQTLADIHGTLTSTVNWIEDYSSCDKLSKEHFEKFKSRFVGH